MRLNLARQHRRIRGQRMGALRGSRCAALFDQRGVAVAHRVRHCHKRQCQVAYAFGGYLRQRRKRGAHHGNGRHAQRFEFGRVTRGPRG